MTANEIYEALKGRKGTNIPVTWERPVKTLKGYTGPAIVKRVSGYFRGGIDYANLATVKEGIESGERGPVQPLPWGTWRVFPFIIEHTPKGQEKGVEYIRLYPQSLDNLKMKVDYFTASGPLDISTVAEYLPASEKAREETPLCFTVKAESILAVG